MGKKRKIIQLSETFLEEMERHVNNGVTHFYLVGDAQDLKKDIAKAFLYASAKDWELMLTGLIDHHFSDEELDLEFNIINSGAN